MENPFKFGTTVDSPFFTDRVKELAYIKQYVNSPNHLILISPRRFGKSSLVKKAIKETGRPCVLVNMQQVTSVEDFASLLLRGVFKLHPLEKLKHYLMNFKVVPTMTTSPMTGEMSFSFNPTLSSSNIILEDTMDLLERVSEPANRLIVVLDEFQEIMEIEKGLDKRLRALMQEQTNVNYIMLGSQESMMTEIFEKVKSPFYHFGMLMHLSPIPEDDFMQYITSRLEPLFGHLSQQVASDILRFTHCHPYYTQQLASRIWEMCVMQGGQPGDDITPQAIAQLVEAHDLDYERIWQTFNRTDRKVMLILARGEQAPFANKSLPTSTVYSSLKKLMKNGYVIRLSDYEIEDPFFSQWIKKML